MNHNDKDNKDNKNKNGVQNPKDTLKQFVTQKLQNNLNDKSKNINKSGVSAKIQATGLTLPGCGTGWLTVEKDALIFTENNTGKKYSVAKYVKDETITLIVGKTSKDLSTYEWDKSSKRWQKPNADENNITVSVDSTQKNSPKQ